MHKYWRKKYLFPQAACLKQCWIWWIFFSFGSFSFHKPLGKYKWQKESLYLNVVRPLLLLSPSAQKNHSVPVPALTCSILYTDIFWMPGKASAESPYLATPPTPASRPLNPSNSPLSPLQCPFHPVTVPLYFRIKTSAGSTSPI